MDELVCWVGAVLRSSSDFVVVVVVSGRRRSFDF